MSEDQAEYVTDALEMIGAGYDDQPAAVIDPPRTVCGIISSSRSCRTASYNFELRLSCCAASHKIGVFYTEEKMRFSDYGKYFRLENNGDLSVRDDFVHEIKKLKGSDLYNVYRFAFGEIDDDELGGAYTIKDERECTYNYIPAKLRWDVFERDDFTCQNCGSRRYLSIDHVFPKSKGGKTTVANCQTLCQHCNSKKGASII